MIDFKKGILMYAFLVMLVIYPRPPPKAEAWSVSGHEIIASRACRIFPGPWGRFFRYYEWLINETVSYPDTFYKGRDPTESPRHYVNLEVWSPDRPEAGTLPFAVEEYARSMSKAIGACDWNRVLLDAGRLSHYVSDICQPYHCTVNYDPKSKSGIGLHAVLDGALTNHLPKIRLVSAVEAQVIANYTEYALFLARQSYGFLTEINHTLIDQDKSWSPRLTEIVENRTNTAIMATVNIWHTTVLASNASALMLPDNRELSIVAISTLQTIDVSHGGVFKFTVTDLLGVKTSSQIRADVAGIALETESYRDLSDPLGSYSTLLPANKFANLGAIAEFTVIAERQGYVSARLVQSVRLAGQLTSLPDHLIYVSIIAAFLMFLSFVLLLRQYRKQLPT